MQCPPSALDPNTDESVDKASEDEKVLEKALLEGPIAVHWVSFAHAPLAASPGGGILIHSSYHGC